MRHTQFHFEFHRESTMKIFVLLTVIIIVNIIDAGRHPRRIHTGKYYQGDLKLSQEQQRFLHQVADVGRTGILGDRYRWPKKHGKVVVPYEIDDNAGYCE
jgi:hypothetical protein